MIINHYVNAYIDKRTFIKNKGRNLMDYSAEYLSFQEICLLEMNVNISNFFQRFIVKKAEFVSFNLWYMFLVKQSFFKLFNEMDNYCIKYCNKYVL